mmetsp:Transcript_2888/g.5384  ORF Transcript_2888/g.5384 Transcript_2888/m.5384 type:complete len:218 (-) Transcript_2888:205-858(-)
MGNDNKSLPRDNSNSYQQIEDGNISAAGRFHVLQFRALHGKLIKLSKDKQTMTMAKSLPSNSNSNSKSKTESSVSENCCYAFGDQQFDALAIHRPITFRLRIDKLSGNMQLGFVSMRANIDSRNADQFSFWSNGKVRVKQPGDERARFVQNGGVYCYKKGQTLALTICSKHVTCYNEDTERTVQIEITTHTKQEHGLYQLFVVLTKKGDGVTILPPQ